MANSQTFTFNIKAVADMKDVATNIQNIQSALGKLKLPDNLKSSFKTTFSSLEKEITKYQDLISNGIKTKSDANALEKSGNTIVRLYDDIVKKINSIDNSALKKAFEDMGAKEVEKLRTELTGLESDLKTKLGNQKFIDFTATKADLKSLTSQFQNAAGQIDASFKTISNSTLNTFFKNIDLGRLDLAEQNLAKIETKAKELNNVDLNNWVQKLRSGFDQLKNSTEISDTTSKIQQLKQEMTTIKADTIAKLVEGFNSGKVSAEQLLGEVTQLITNTTSWGHAQAQTNKELDQVKSRIQYFFGLNNAINLVKRAIRGAITTIKELDQAMTETAVVTDFTVSDMWEQLPEYTKRANELGVTTKAAYEAATLYYQQGLTTKEVTELSVETLKMARIAGLDAADATDRMTNALRGFNMELNETNAQRVDDVYSRLAAISASNVDEISTAMTKVASLAHNAGMEFETTAAFLAQIIETTRESAETAGTALKTVVARFAEVKKLVSESELTGEDEEGEVINVNKVQEALRSAGIDLSEYFLGEVGIDDIFMELAEKWDSLTSLQQRYIATQAAGSRQQSRFIALMSDYARTQELVGEAYNANGAAATQFAKTQESLESKLARLKNAWNEFLMGLTNSSVVKVGVDLLTDLLNVINKLTSAFGEGTGSILKWATAILTLRGASSFFRTGGGFDALFKGQFGSNVAGALTGGGAAGATKRTSIVGALGSSLWGGAKGIGSSIWGGTFGAGAELTGGAGVIAGLTGVATALGAVAVAAGTVYTAYQAWLRLTPAGQTKLAEKNAESMENVKNAVQKTADQYADAVTQVNKYNDAVNNATSTEEKTQAVRDRTEYIQSLLEENAAFAKYVDTSIEGGELVLTINEEQLATAASEAAKAAAEAAVNSYFATSMSYNKQADYYRSLLNGVDLEKGTITQTSATGGNGNVTWTRALTEKETALYTSYQLKIDEAVRAMELEAQQAFAAMFESQGLDFSDELANYLSEVLSKTVDNTEVPSVSPLWWLHGRGYWEEQYLGATGTEASSDISTKDLAVAVAQAAYTEEQKVYVTNWSDIAKASNNTEGFTDMLGTYLNKETFNNQNLSLFDTNQEGKIYEQLFGYTNIEDLFKDMASIADELGITVDALNDQIKANVEEQRQYQTNQLNKAAAEMYGSGSKAGVSDDTMVDFLHQFYELASFDLQQSIIDLFSSVSSSDLAGPLIESLTQAFSNGQLDEAVTGWLEGLDLSNPIYGLAQLTEAANDSNEAISGIANAILNDEEAMKQFSATSQLETLLLSESFEDLDEDLQDFIDDNGKITAANINELAKSNKDLNQFLDNGTIKAKALASALTGIKTGKVDMEDFNDAIIAAINSMNSLDDIVEETIDDLNDFDPGYDENDITDFITTVYDNATENIEKGAYGNNTMRNYMEKIFGEFDYSGVSDYGEEYKAWLSENVTWLEQNKDNMESAWTDFSNSLSNSQLELRDTITGETLKTAEVISQNGEIIINTNGMTTSELIDAMVQTGELTETQARMMIADFKNYSADFAHEMAENDLGDAIEAWAENARTSATGAIVYTDEELQTLAAVLNVSYDEVKEAVQNLQNVVDKNGNTYTLQEITGIDLSSKDSFVKSLEEAGYTVTGTLTLTNEQLHEFVRQRISTDNLVDIDGLKTACDNLQLSFEESLNALVGDANSFTALINGEATEVSVQAGETAAEAYNRTVSEIAQQDFATSIGEAVANAINKDGYHIQFVVDDEDGTIKIIQNVEDKIQEVEGTHDVNFYCDTDIAVGEIDNLAQAYYRLAAGIDEATSSQIAYNNAYSGQTTTSSADTHALGAGAVGGYVSAYAQGLADSFSSGINKLSAGLALTGEEGPEIVWNKDKGYAYITGSTHPEFRRLQPGDRIFNAQETRKILGNAARGGKVPSYARGYEDTTRTPSSDYNSSSSDSTTEPTVWENELDWIYNLVQDIESLERTQTKLSEQHDRYLEDISKTGRDLYNTTKSQLDNLYTQRDNQIEALTRRRQEMDEQIGTSGYGEYVQWNDQDQTLEIDWDAIEAIQDKDTYDEVVDLISDLESIQDEIQDAQDGLWDIEGQIKELEDRYLDAFTDFQDRVMDAVVSQYQSQIDELSSLNDTLNDVNAEIISSLQEEIALSRQIRDNTKTEENIADMEARLAYLRRDTTGANDQEIRSLEQQLEEQRQSYEDTLVDQAIDQLSSENEKAAEQREQQISLMSEQLEYWQETGELWGEVNRLINEGMGPDGSLVRGSELETMLRDAEGWKGMSEEQKAVWADDLILSTNQVGAYLIQIKEGLDGVSSGVWANLPSSSVTSEKLDWGDDSSSYSYSDYSEYVDAWSDYVTGVQDQWDELMKQYEDYWSSFGFATGGLNTSTGLAMLHGTPSEPEYVLNARQTDAFLKLADILPSALGEGGNTTNNLGGNIYVELAMNNNISSDYDVEQMVDKVKKEIYDASQYRNTYNVGTQR